MMKRLRDEEGFTTVGMAVSIFLALALIFTGAQAYRVESAAAEIQEVADSAALAAESEVAEFVTAVNTCDAVLLSMTLLAGTLYGAAIVCACIPPTMELSAKILELADRTLSARDRFYETAANSLNAIQRMLPFLAAAHGMNIASANDEGVMQAHYFAVAALVPAEGIELGCSLEDDLAELGADVNDEIDDVREAAQQAEEAAQKAQESKLRAFMYDCGNAPAYCMYERAGHLSTIASEDNPLYTSVDAWSFQVALSRAQAYYATRANAALPTGGSVEARGEAVIRKRFYDYAIEELQHAYVRDTGDACEIYFPHLFRNTKEMRETPLYTECLYPVTMSTQEEGAAGDGGAAKVMHAWDGCPKAASASYLGAVSELDGGGFEKCDQCGFVIASLGNVASASTSIANGFEHHYEQVRLASLDYVAARADADQYKTGVKDKVTPLLDKLKDVLGSVAAQRFEAEPPGRAGCIAMVVNTAQNRADTGFESLFVAGGTTLGTRAAVSGATLLADETEDAGSVITKIVAGLSAGIPFLSGPLGIAASCWTSLLKVYKDGQTALTDGLRSVLDSFPLLSASGLGTWAAEALTSVIESMGLQPADVRCKLPVLVNTGHIAAADEGAFAVHYAEVKTQALAASTSSTTLMASIASKVRSVAQGKLDETWSTIAHIELPFGTVDSVIQWIVPESVREGASEAVENGLDALESSIAGLDAQKSWK